MAIFQTLIFFLITLFVILGAMSIHFTLLKKAQYNRISESTYSVSALLNLVIAFGIIVSIASILFPAEEDPSQTKYQVAETGPIHHATLPVWHENMPEKCIVEKGLLRIYAHRNRLAFENISQFELILRLSVYDLYLENIHQYQHDLAEIFDIFPSVPEFSGLEQKELLHKETLLPGKFISTQIYPPDHNPVGVHVISVQTGSNVNIFNFDKCPKADH